MAEVPQRLKQIREKLYTSNEYNVEYQSTTAVLPPGDVEYLRANYGIRTDRNNMCINCQARQLIKYYGEKTEELAANQFHIRCEGVPKSLDITREALDGIIATKNLEKERALLYLKSTKDPVAWCSLMFGFKDSDAKWHLRPYQKEQLRCSSLRMVLRMGRRAGKSFLVALKLLYLAFNKTYSKGSDSNGREILSGPEIMIITPYQSQITNLFNEMEKLLKRNQELAGQCSSGTGGGLYVKTPFFRMEFQNGAKISGFVSGVGIKSDGVGGGTMRGQCLPVDTRIIMADGSFKRIDSLKLGDKVFSKTLDGKDTVGTVSHLFDKEIKDEYVVTLASGRKVRASKDHKLLGSYHSKTHRHRLLDQEKFFLQEKPLEEWKPGEYLATTTSAPERSSSDLTDDEVYFSGLMTGDGCCTRRACETKSLSFSAGYPEVVLGFIHLSSMLGLVARPSVSKVSNCTNIRISARNYSEAAEILSKAGILGCGAETKQLDDRLLFLPEAQRKLLVGSLITTDGWIYTNDQKFEIGYVSTSRKLAEQVQFIFQSFGVGVSLREKPIHGHQTQYVVSVKSVRGVQKILPGMRTLNKSAQQERALLAASLKRDGTSGLHVNSIYLDRIVSIEKQSPILMMDIEVGDTSNFILENGVVVHNSADIIYLDEMDMIPEDVLDKVIIPILATTDEVMLIATSTPIGKHGRFRKWCLERLDFKEDHYPSTVLPQWDTLKTEVRAENSEESFRAEYMAEFLDGAYGVFKPTYVYGARQDYRYEDCESPRWWHEEAKVKETSQLIKVIGIDWNKNAGTEFVVVAYDPASHRWFVIESVNLTVGSFSSARWKEEVIRLNYKHKPEYIYADEGYGHTIIEDLKVIAHATQLKANKDRRDLETVKLLDRLIAFNFSSKVELVSPIDGAQVTKTGKEYLVENAIRIFEDQRIWYPESDDVLRKQLLNYIVLRRSITTNRPVYGCENSNIGDHRLDALMLALAGLSLEFSIYSKKSTPMSEPAFLPKADLDARSALKQGKSALELLKERSAAPDKFGRSQFAMHQDDFLKTVSDRKSAGKGIHRRGKMDQQQSLFGEIAERAKDYRGYATDTEHLYQESKPGIVQSRRARERGNRSWRR